MKQRQIVRQGRKVALVACGLLMSAWALQSCKDDDLLTGQPDWLGNSIYERLSEEGNFKYTLQLIDDMGQHEVLSHTGSKTLFAAPDSAYEIWFRQNAWGVRNYNQLTTAQKKLLLNNSMINNAYLIELMSNGRAQGDAATPEEGRTMRRETATSIYDSVFVMKPEQMPNTSAWATYRERGKSIPLLKDATTPPMIHFLPAYMTYNKITDEDLSVLTNKVATSTKEAWVNGKKVVERDITCKNGYIHKVNGVIESNPNMAEIIRTHANMSMWSHLLDRYSAPYYDASATREYNRIYNNEDSVFVLRYYSKRSVGGNENARDPQGNPVTPYLSFDPGWNQYIDGSSSSDLHYDAGVMMVPTNEALEAWWNDQGRDLRDEYKEWDSIPDNTLAKLINVNMLSTFSEAVPSKFNTVLNDAKEVLGITEADIDSCFMGCNGVVYLTNKVFTPAEYSSVAYPALAHASTMNIIYWAIDNRNYLPYLLSMDSKYALLIPTNDAMLYFIDPGSYGKTANVVDEETGEAKEVESPDLIEFRYDKTKPAASRVQASRYACTIDADGNITKGDRTQVEVAANVINTMLDQLMDQLIIVMPDKSKTVEDYVAEGYNYFKSRGGSMVRVTKNAAGQLCFEGGWQMEHNHRLIPSTERYQKENGVSYQLDAELPLGAQRSLYMTLREHDEYKSFMNLLENDYSDLLTQKLSNKYNPGNAALDNKNLKLFDNYNYTVYIPTNESIAKIQDLTEDGHSGKNAILPSWSELEMGDENDEVIDSICKAEGWYESNPNRATVLTNVKAAIKTIVTDFIRYHVHDNSVAIGMAHDPSKDSKYESMKRNLETGRFYPITVKYDTKNMTITDNAGNERHVITTNPALYNNVVREYWFEGKDRTARLFMGSGAVVHLIDGPLEYDKMKPWRDVVKEAIFN